MKDGHPPNIRRQGQILYFYLKKILVDISVFYEIEIVNYLG